jgi:hypothetical protein
VRVHFLLRSGRRGRSFHLRSATLPCRARRTKIILQHRLADLCVKHLQIHRRLIDGRGSRAEQIGRAFLQLPLPFRDLVRMNLKLLRQFCQRARHVLLPVSLFALERRCVPAPDSLRHRLVSFVGIMPI